MTFPSSLTLDEWTKIVSTISTFAIGVAASVLAYQQFRLSRSKLRFDLYGKRLGIFKIVRDFASILVLRGEVDSGQLYRDSVERYFLFEKDVCSYIDQMYERAQEVEHTKRELLRPNLTDGERQALNAQLVERKSWFFDQSDNMIKIFSKDLSIKTLRWL